MHDLYLGHTASYWLELQLQADKLDYSRLIKELADLRSKLGMYESSHDQLVKQREVLYGTT